MFVSELISRLETLDADLPVVLNHDLGACLMPDTHLKIGFYRPNSPHANAVDIEFYENCVEEEEKPGYVMGLIL